MKSSISDEFMTWFLNTWLIFMLIMAWISLGSINRIPESSGTVDVFLEPLSTMPESHPIEGRVEVTLEPLPENKIESKWIPDLTPEPTEEKTISPRPQKPLHGLYKSGTTIHTSDKDFQCLARNVYYESRGEPYVGKIGVAQITYNRLKTGRWGRTFCSVVFSKKQFSWTNDLSVMKLPHGSDWVRSRKAAHDFINGVRVAQLDHSDHYHAVSVDPKWNRSMHRSDKLGQHVFYARNP